MTQRSLVGIAFPKFVLLDLAGPCDVFWMANRVWNKSHPRDPAPYVIKILSTTSDVLVSAASGLKLAADAPIGDWRGTIDTLLVPGGIDLQDALRDAHLLKWLHAASARTRRVGSICTGAFILAAAGLLDGRTATTHWEDCGQLAAQYPDVHVAPDRIFVRHGNVYTSAGVTAGMDLALALVEEDLGQDVSLKVAQELVMFVRRPGGQSQFSTILEAQAATRQPIRDLAMWMAEHPASDLSVEALAGRVHMSTRNFSRTFRRELAKTPARFVETLRVEAARRMLEESDGRMDHIARECGLGSGNSMLRSFLRVLGVSPSEYRERFRRNASAH
jgi:transcriptional regulator GlxA family with amidase domain